MQWSILHQFPSFFTYKASLLPQAGDVKVKIHQKALPGPNWHLHSSVGVLLESDDVFTTRKGVWLNLLKMRFLLVFLPNTFCDDDDAADYDGKEQRVCMHQTYLRRLTTKKSMHCNQTRVNVKCPTFT